LRIRRSLEILTVILGLGITTDTVSDNSYDYDNSIQQRQEYHERQKIKEAARLYWPRLDITTNIPKTAVC